MYGTHTVLDFVLMRKLIHSNSALCTVSVRQFGILSSALLQIPSHNSHPRFWLTVSTANSVVDFHHQVIVYDGRSTLNKTGQSSVWIVLFFAILIKLMCKVIYMLFKLILLPFLLVKDDEHL